MRTRLGRLRFVLGAAWRTDRRKTFAVFVLIGAESIAAGAVTLGLKWIFDGITSGDWPVARVAIVVTTAAQVFFLFGGRTRENFQLLISQRLAVEIDEGILRLVAAIPGLEHQENPAYLDRLKLTLGQGGVLATAAWSVINAVSVIARLSISVWLLVTVDTALILLPLFAVPSMLLASPAQRRVHSAQARTAEDARAEEHLHRLFLDLGTSKEMRVFGAADVVDGLAGRLHRAVTDGLLRGRLHGSLFQLAGWGVFGAGYFFALLIVARGLLRGTATIGDAVLLTQLATQLRGQVAGAVGQVTSFSDAVATLERTMWLEDYARQSGVELDGGRISISCPSGAPPIETISQGIAIRDVSFRYPGTDRDVLNALDLDLAAGSTVALVGENGAGKTTLVKLLCGFYLPTQGTIRVDGLDVRQLDPDAWRSRTAACFQDFARLEFIARESIGVGWLPHIELPERVLSAVDRGDAGAIIDRLASGLETPLGRTHWHGAELSGGQWQRLALARAMMREHPLLVVLDEPSSALDARAEHELFERYATAAKTAAADNGAITVLVSHRFSTVRMADSIVVMDKGNIIEQGTHEDLVASRGLYAELYDLQARSYG